MLLVSDLCLVSVYFYSSDEFYFFWFMSGSGSSLMIMHDCLFIPKYLCVSCSRTCYYIFMLLQEIYACSCTVTANLSEYFMNIKGLLIIPGAF